MGVDWSQPMLTMVADGFGDGAGFAGIDECLAEFGPHEDHEDCARIIAEMSAGYPDEYDTYAGGWYDYEAGLHWSDFVDGPIGD